MPLLEAFLDVEAGQHPAEYVRNRAPTIDPTRLRHRVQNSQRFVIGKASTLAVNIVSTGLPVAPAASTSASHAKATLDSTAC